MPSRFAPILRPELSDLLSYEPLPGTFEVRLDANESPSLLSPEACDAISRALMPANLNRYPDARCWELRKAIAERCGAEPDEVLPGIGSDEVIALILSAMSRPRGQGVPNIVTTSPTFVMYRQSARARGFNVVEVPLDAKWDLDVASMRRAFEFSRPNVVFIATPNNPTGNLMSRDRLEAVIEAAPDAFVIVDEAYVDFAAREQIDLRKKYPHVGVLRTISKVGFAALRVGWLIAPADLVREIDKVRQPFSIPTPSQRAATLILRELRGEIERMAGIVKAERARLTAGLEKLGFEVTPSDANFVWARTQRPAADVLEALKAKSILVKSFHHAKGRLTNQLRITVGLASENDRLLAEISQAREI